MWGPREPGGCEEMPSCSLYRKTVSTRYDETEAANKGVTLRDENYVENASTANSKEQNPCQRKSDYSKITMGDCP